MPASVTSRKDSFPPPKIYSYKDILVLYEGTVSVRRPCLNFNSSQSQIVERVAVKDGIQEVVDIQARRVKSRMLAAGPKLRWEKKCL